MRALPMLLMVAACSYKPEVGQLAAGDGPVEGDGPAPDGKELDAPPDSFVGPTPTACVQKWLDGTMTFTSPAILNSNNNDLFTTADERDPTLTSDELTIFYTRPSGSGDEDVLVSTRASTGANFVSPSTFVSLSDSNLVDGKVALTADDLTTVMASARGGGEGGVDLWQATRTSGGTTAFPALTQQFLENVNDTGNQRDPHLSPDGLRLYLSTGSPQKIVVASRTAALASFGTPVEIPVIGDPAGDADPTLSGDERVIVFASNRGGGEGGTDLWYATRPERDQPFTTPVALGTINSNENDSDPFLTADGCRLYFASTQTAGGSDFDMLVSTVQ